MNGGAFWNTHKTHKTHTQNKQGWTPFATHAETLVAPNARGAMETTTTTWHSITQMTTNK